MNPSAGGGSGVLALRRLVQSRPPAEVCDFCSVPLAARHRHLLELATRKTVCVCHACALTFEGAVGRWKLIPRDARSLPGFRMSDIQWDALGVPIDLAFFVYSTPAQRLLALYPSPAGPTEAALPAEAWQELVAANPPLARLEPDVDALLVYRLHAARQYYLAPIDLCFELVGLVRTHWRGFSGGDRIWQEIDAFFARLKEDAQSLPRRPEVAHA